MVKRTWTAVLLAVLMVAAALPAVAADSSADPEAESSYELTQFNDTAGSTFENAINWLVDQGITVGCNPPTYTNFCPDDPVTRGQMAVFITRALSLPAASDDYFDDDNGAFYENSANRLFEAGISAGCNPPANNNFCGGEEVTRAQMATFLNRGFGLTATNIDYFTDDNGSVHETSINRVRSANITVGCNPPASDNFCPGDTVTRGQMSAFIKRAVEWQTNPQAPPPPPPSGGGGGGTPPPQAGPCGGITITPLADCQALVSLYNATNGAAWLSKVGWNAGDPCVVPWEGIQCTGGRVTTVGLDANGLSGTIPNLSALTELRELDLGENSLTGGIPTSLQNLKKLQTLRLEQNQLTGQIPGALGSIGTQLQFLDLSANANLVGEIPVQLWNLTGLTTLNLSQTGLSGGLSESIGNLSNLQFLSLGETVGISGPLPDALTSLTNLTFINLSGSDFEKAKLTGPIPSNIGNLTQLQTLDLEDSSLSGPIPASLGTLAALTYLDLSGMPSLDGQPFPVALTNPSLNGLTWLDISDNGLTGTVPAGIGVIGGSLQTFDMSSNNLSGELPGDIQDLGVPAPGNLQPGGLVMDDQGGNCFTVPDQATLDFMTAMLIGIPPLCDPPLVAP